MKERYFKFAHQASFNATYTGSHRFSPMRQLYIKEVQSQLRQILIKRRRCRRDIIFIDIRMRILRVKHTLKPVQSRSCVGSLVTRLIGVKFIYICIENIKMELWLLRGRAPRVWHYSRNLVLKKSSTPPKMVTQKKSLNEIATEMLQFFYYTNKKHDIVFRTDTL